MPWGVAAAAVGAGISAVASKKQSGAVSAGQNQANQLSQETIRAAQELTNQDKVLYQPYTQQGTQGLGAYTNILGLNGPDAAKSAMNAFTASPGYQYQLDQGLRAVDAGAASRGLLHSGATIKAEQTLGNNLANQDFGNYVTRLNSLAGLGLQGAQGESSATKTYLNLLTGQSEGQQGTDTSAAGQQASIYGNEGQNLSNAVGGVVKNGLYSYANGGFGGSSNPSSANFSWSNVSG